MTTDAARAAGTVGGTARPGPVDAYLAEVRRAMAGMDGRVREDILQELRSHVAESTQANGGNTGLALAGLGPAREVGRGYRDLYGYGLRFQALFLAIAAALAIPSVPVLGLSPEGLLTPYWLSVPFLAALAGWLLWVGLRAGSQVGLYAGLTALFVRSGAVAAVALIEPGVVAAAGGIALLVAVSVVLVLLGWLPGTARKAWSGPRAEI